ncbi:MAG: hypothetical protein PHU27_03950 [Salinivirgaceae bacterium]|nr:hypothetical protein [Salinivirgaceae bacterium]MDD4746948.1 hypothetical protein [Salinivirgaceae bacterium]MDY0279458.1 hypothetical protein [Salinivirgaceae bacterium]
MSFFKTQKKEKNILDLFTYDITTFFYGDYEEVESTDTESMFMIVYEKPLPWVELGCLDTIQFRVFFDKDNFTGSNPVNVRLFQKKGTSSLEAITKINDKIYGLYGKDDDKRGKFSEQDKIEVNNQDWERRWTIEKGESFITVYMRPTGLELNILFLNNLIKHTGKYLNIKG